MPRRHFGGLLGPMMLALGVLPPLPDPEPRKSLTVGPTLPTDETDVVGRFTIGDEVIKVRAGESQEEVQRRVDASLERQRRGFTVVNEPYAITLRPRPTLSPLFTQPAPDMRPLPSRPKDPKRKAKRKAQAKARRKGRR